MFQEAQWTPETIQRFWDFYSSNQAAHDTYFSKMVGEGVLRVARKKARLENPVVDMGCGVGYFLNQLLDAGYSCIALDSSQKSIDGLREKFASRPGLLKAEVGDLEAIPLADDEAGSMFLIEVLEHLDSDYTEKVFGEFQRVIRSGGHIVVTVPHNENLDAKKVACPSCGCVFHRMQHMRSFTVDSLSELLRSHSFEPVFVEALNFNDHMRGLANRLTSWGRRLQGKMTPRQAPHLIGIGRLL